MTTQDRIDAVKAELAQLEAELKKEQSAEWPTVGDEVWAVYSDGDVDCLTWEADASDLGRLSIGNIFRTEEHVDREIEARKVIAELRSQPGRCWLDGTRNVYGLCLLGAYTRLGLVSYQRADGSWQSIYFDTEANRNAAIAAVGEDRIKRAAAWLGRDKP